MAYEDAIVALADPTRRAVFERLRHGPVAVGEIANDLPVSRPAVSQHLRVLARAQLVQHRRAGTRRLYSIDRRGLEALRNYVDRFWTDVVDAFEQACDTPESKERKPQ